MKLFYKGKDGGKESKVHGYWLFESKKFGSIVLLRFDEGSREAHHTHAFNAISWVVKGELKEVLKDTGEEIKLAASIKPVFTARERFHRVFGMAKHTWVLSFRGPWVPTWKEFLPKRGEIVLTNGRKEVG
jgi:hypothetical protein